MKNEVASAWGVVKPGAWHYNYGIYLFYRTFLIDMSSAGKMVQLKM
jgi:hypothetical protein